MKVVFLDIDGVLNMYGASYRTFMKPYGQHIEPHLVNRLNYILEKVEDLKIVISSSWRNDMKDLENQMKKQGFKFWDRVIGKTIHDKTGFRGFEILEWFVKNTAEKYLVIDDEITDICGDYCNVIPGKNVLKIDGNEGLLNKDAIFIVDFFND